MSTVGARAGRGEPVKIGVIIGLTGSAAVAGNDSAAAIKLAVEEVNQAGGVLGRPIELVVEDDEGRPKSGVEARQQARRCRQCRRRDRRLPELHRAPRRPGAEREGRGLGHRRHHQRAEDRRPLPVQYRGHRRAGGRARRLRQGGQAGRQEAHRHLPEQPDRPGPPEGEREAGERARARMAPRAPLPARRHRFPHRAPATRRRRTPTPS